MLMPGVLAAYNRLYGNSTYKSYSREIAKEEEADGYPNQVMFRSSRSLSLLQSLCFP